MDARAGGVEVLAREGIVVRNAVVEFLLEILGDFRDDGGIGGLVVAGEGNVVDDQRFEGRVAGAFAKAHERAVDAAAAIQPCGHAVDEHLMEVVVPVPFEPCAGDARFVGEGADDALHGAGEAAAPGKGTP